MANPVCEVRLTEAPLHALAQIEYGSGAIVDFFGAVRPVEAEREISGIQYEANSDMALHQLEKIAGEAVTQFRLTCAIVHHRLGFVPTGEASVFVRTSGRHRRETYDANAWIMNELKNRVPIWKWPQFASVDQVLTAEPEALVAR